MAITLAAMYFMYVQYIQNVMPWVFSISMFLIFALFFVDSFYEINQGQSLDEINKYKRRLYYGDQYFTVDYPYLEQKEIIYWSSIEAIFLSNSPPLDGEYHNFEYSIFLNSTPHVVKYEVQNWFNRLSIFPTPKMKVLPILKIRDDDNRDFHTFDAAIHKYLTEVNRDSTKYLTLKFGNEMHIVKSEDTTKGQLHGSIKSLGFYSIYDRNSSLADPTLLRYRQEAQNL